MENVMSIFHPKLQGASGSRGVDYQIKLLQFFLLKRSYNITRIPTGFHNHQNFKISTENTRAGNFDDVVCETEDASILLQAKFDKDQKTISFGQLFLSSTKNDFSVFKYLQTFPKISNNFDIDNIRNVVICTNAQFNLKDINEFLNQEIETVNQIYLKEENIIYPISSIKNSKCYSFDQNQDLLVKYISKNLTDISKDVIRIFLDKLLLVSVFNEDLNDQIRFLIKEMDIIDKNIPLKLMNNAIFTQVKTWFQSVKGTYLTHDNVIAFIYQLKSLIYITNKIKSLPMLNQTKTDKLPSDSLEHNLVIFKIKNKETYDLQLLIICQALLNKLITQNKTNDEEALLEKMLFVDPSAPVNVIKNTINSFKVPEYVYLIIPIFDIVQKFNDIKNDLRNAIDVQKNKSYKKIIIIITDNLDTEIEKFFPNFTVFLTNNIKLSDLFDEIQNKILQKQITYQGCSISLIDLIRNYELTDDIIDEPTLLKLLSIDKKIIINNTFENCKIIPFYINRTFIEIDKEKYSDYYENTSGEFSNKLSEEEFCSKITDESNNKFFSIFDYPGMGKSTILKKLSQLLRKTQYWIIKIDLNKHTNILFRLSKENRKSITLDEFLNLLQYPVKATFETNLFNIPKNVILLLDALDEISPEYSDLILNSLISIASNENIRKIVITSRPHILKHLKDKNMECSVFALQQFTTEEIIDYLSNLWYNKLNIEPKQSNFKKVRDFANNLISKLNSMIGWYKMETFMGIPLQTKMIGVVFEKHCKDILDDSENNNLILPKEFTLKWLYDEFIEQKKDIYIEEKCNASGNVCVMEALEKIFNDAITDHIREALKIEFPREFYNSFEIISSPQLSEDNNLIKMGILMKSSDRVYFSHRTWSEYFSAQYIFDQIMKKEKSTIFLKYFKCEKFSKCLIDTFSRNSFLSKMVVTNIESISELFTNHFIHIFLNNNNFGFLYDFELIFSLVRKEGYENLFWSRSITALYTFHNGFGYQYNKQLLKLLNEVENINIRHTTTGITPLHLACKSNSKEIVELLISKGHPIDVLDNDGKSILHYAVKGGQINHVEFLLDKGHPVDVQDKKGRTPLFDAIYQTNVDIAQLLLKKGHSIDITDNTGLTPLHYASHCGLLKFIELLLKKGHPINFRDNAGKTPLHYAVLSGFEVTEYLIKKGHPPDVSDKAGRTPLYDAVRLGKTDIIQLLLKKGHQINIDDNSEDMLRFASIHNDVTFLKTLVSEGQSIYISDIAGRTPLHHATYLGQENATVFLINLGHPINITDNAGRTPLHCAAQSGNVKIMELLLKNNHHLNVYDEVGATPLHLAAKHIRFDIVDFLLSKGYLIDDCDHLGRSPLHYAARWAISDMSAFLICNGHPICVHDKYGRTPLHYAVLSFNNVQGYEIQIKSRNIDYLLKKGHPIDAKDRGGKTPLHLAAIMNLTTVVEILLNKGHPVEVIDNRKKTPLYYAKKYGFNETVKCFGVRVAICE